MDGGKRIKDCCCCSAAKSFLTLCDPVDCSLLGCKCSWIKDGSDSKESHCNAGDLGLTNGLERLPWRRAWQPTPVLLPGESPWTEERGRL